MRGGMSGLDALAVGFGGSAETTAEETAEGGQAFKTRQTADRRDGFFCFKEELPGGGEADVDDVLMGGDAEAVAEHAEEVLAVEHSRFGHRFQ